MHGDQEVDKALLLRKSGAVSLEHKEPWKRSDIRPPLMRHDEGGSEQ